jgi:hypothetical protein
MRVSQDVIRSRPVNIAPSAPAYIKKTRSPPKWTFSIISIAMDKTTSVVAALKAGKQPSQLRLMPG